jgi:4-hydroxy-tetrahydrodipicolinate synthase
MNLTGCGTALVTPFRKDGGLDEGALVKLVDWQIKSGINFVLSCGSTGEAATLEEDEWLRAVAVTSEAAAKRVPVWAGCTDNSTARAVAKAKKLAAQGGIDAVLSASPYYNKPTQEGQYVHFRAIAEAIFPLPLVLYNIPGRTGITIEPATVVRLANDVPNIEGIKDSSGKIDFTANLVRQTPSNFSVFCGDDYMALGAISVGARGLISVATNEIPAELTQMVAAALKNDFAGARNIERKYATLMGANFWESNPAPAKFVLSLMGICEATVRLPLLTPSAPISTRLEKLAAELGLKA